MERKQKEAQLPRRPGPARASWLSAMMLFAPLALIAELLIARTHHRPLGAAVFATAAILLWIFAEVTSRRLLDASACSVRAKNRKWMWVLSSTLTAVVLFRGIL